MSSPPRTSPIHPSDSDQLVTETATRVAGEANPSDLGFATDDRVLAGSLLGQTDLGIIAGHREGLVRLPISGVGPGAPIVRRIAEFAIDDCAVTSLIVSEHQVLIGSDRRNRHGGALVSESNVLEADPASIASRRTAGAYHPSPIARALSLGSAVRSVFTTTITAASAITRGPAVSPFRWSSAVAKATDAATASAIALSSAGTIMTRRFKFLAVLAAVKDTNSCIPSVAVSKAVTHGRIIVSSGGGSPADCKAYAINLVPRTAARSSAFAVYRATRPYQSHSVFGAQS